MNGKDKRRRPFRRDGRNHAGQDSRTTQENKGDFRTQKQAGKSALQYDKNGVLHERPRWIAPKLDIKPLPDLNCSYCGQPIVDAQTALTDKLTGEPVHFDCVMSELAKQEKPEAGDTLSYIGGGRFGIVHFGGGRVFAIKKIVEWEDKEKKVEWRGVIADHYSIT